MMISALSLVLVYLGTQPVDGLFWPDAVKQVQERELNRSPPADDVPLPPYYPYNPSTEERTDHRPGPQSCSCNCDTGSQSSETSKCEWRMVFKAVKGNGRMVGYDFYEYGWPLNDHTHKAKELASSLPYRNSAILDNWGALDIRRVKLEVYDEGDRKAWFYFDSSSANMMNWMAEDRLIASSYSDLKDGDKDAFRVGGYYDRDIFVINRVEDTCSTDCGYIMLVDNYGPPLCDYEDTEARPFILYSSVDHCAVWNDPSEAKIADRVVVSAMVCDHELDFTPAERYLHIFYYIMDYD